MKQQRTTEPLKSRAIPRNLNSFSKFQEVLNWIQQIPRTFYEANFLQASIASNFRSNPPVTHNPNFIHLFVLFLSFISFFCFSNIPVIVFLISVLQKASKKQHFKPRDKQHNFRTRKAGRNIRAGESIVNRSELWKIRNKQHSPKPENIEWKKSEHL